MRIQPNRTVLEGEVLRIERCSDGYGADVALRVEANLSAGQASDFCRARAGETLTLFTAMPEAVSPGSRYRIEATVLGGARGERIVMGKAEAIAGPR
jgi:hypothetical protein